MKTSDPKYQTSNNAVEDRKPDSITTVEIPSAEDPDPTIDRRPFIFRYITAICRTVGLACILVIWAFTVELLRHVSEYKYTPWYMLGMASLTTFLEVIWLINKCATCGPEGCCCRVWRALLWLSDEWRKTLVYVGLAVPCFVRGVVALYAVLSGCLLLLMAVLSLLKSFRNSSCVQPAPPVPVVDITSPKVNLVGHEVQTDVKEMAADKQGDYSSFSTTSVTSTHAPTDTAVTREAS